MTGVGKKPPLPYVPHSCTCGICGRCKAHTRAQRYQENKKRVSLGLEPLPRPALPTRERRRAPVVLWWPLITSGLVSGHKSPIEATRELFDAGVPYEDIFLRLPAYVNTWEEKIQIRDFAASLRQQQKAAAKPLSAQQKSNRRVRIIEMYDSGVPVEDISREASLSVAGTRKILTLSGREWRKVKREKADKVKKASQAEWSPPVLRESRVDPNLLSIERAEKRAEAYKSKHTSINLNRIINRAFEREWIKKKTS